MDCIATIVSLFFATLFLFFFFRNPQGLYGAYIVRQIKKGKLTNGKKYFPQYFTEEEARSYGSTITILEGLLLFSLACIPATIPWIIVPVPFIVLSYYLIKKIIKMYREKTTEFKEKYGTEWKPIYRLYYCIGIHFLIKIGWNILGFAFVIVMFIFNIFFDSRSEDEKLNSYLDSLER